MNNSKDKKNSTSDARNNKKDEVYLFKLMIAKRMKIEFCVFKRKSKFE